MENLTEARRLRGIELSLIRKVLQSAPPEAINLALGELGFPLPEILRHKALELLQTSTPVYTPNAGIAELRDAVAARYPGAVADSVCICNGAEEAIFITLLSLIDPGDTVAIPDPDYPAYSSICNILEAKVIRLPYESDLLSVDWDRWEVLLAGGVKALIFSHPSNPCGHVFSAEEVERLSTICSENGVAMVLDGIYDTLCFSEPPPSFCCRSKSLFMIGGLSKSHCMSGWRLGWVVSPPSLAASVIKARQYVSTCSNWLSQHLGSFALTPTGMQSAKTALGLLKDSRRFALQRMGHSLERVLVPPASPFLMLKVDGDDLKYSQKLAGKGVICVPGRAFGEVSRGWLRINIGVPQEKLSPALDIICDELSLY